MIRGKPNSWDRIRNKLRGIDWAALLLGIHQEWATNPGLMALTNYCKANNAGKGSDTIAITVTRVKQIIKFIQMIHLDGVSIPSSLICANIEKWSGDQIKWYEMIIGLILALSTGLRGAEQYNNEEKCYKGYGLKITDIKWIWKDTQIRKKVLLHYIN